MMRFLSTRSARGVRAETLTLSDALAQGLAPDGGLYMPETLPALDPAIFRATAPDPRALFVARTTALLAPFFAGDRLEAELPAIVAGAFTFDAPVHTPNANSDYRFLELFHGPTAAFKDIGARFLAECLSRNLEEETTILVATSGDTGAAVAGAFHGRPGFRVVILYPDGRVSPRQAHQLGAFGGNVSTYRVAGTFDDCQAMVKAAFAEQARAQDAGKKRPTATRLASANSISLGRLLPQMSYYVHAALSEIETAKERGIEAVSFSIPTGNLGNGFAALLARSLRSDDGRALPLGTITFATNANRVVVDYLAGGKTDAAPRLHAPTRATLANAMDVGAPSNLERLRSFVREHPEAAGHLRGISVEDAAIRATIARVFEETGYAICPHTACAVHALVGEARPLEHTVIAATAHPAKFETIVEPICGPVAIPEALAELLTRPATATPLPADARALLDVL